MYNHDLLKDKSAALDNTLKALAFVLRISIANIATNKIYNASTDFLTYKEDDSLNLHNKNLLCSLINKDFYTLFDFDSKVNETLFMDVFIEEEKEVLDNKQNTQPFDFIKFVNEFRTCMYRNIYLQPYEDFSTQKFTFLPITEDPFQPFNGVLTRPVNHKQGECEDIYFYYLVIIFIQHHFHISTDILASIQEDRNESDFLLSELLKIVGIYGEECERTIRHELISHCLMKTTNNSTSLKKYDFNIFELLSRAMGKAEFVGNNMRICEKDGKLYSKINVAYSNKVHALKSIADQLSAFKCAEIFKVESTETITQPLYKNLEQCLANELPFKTVCMWLNQVLEQVCALNDLGLYCGDISPDKFYYVEGNQVKFCPFCKDFNYVIYNADDEGKQIKQISFFSCYTPPEIRLKKKCKSVEKIFVFQFGLLCLQVFGAISIEKLLVEMDYNKSEKLYEELVGIFIGKIMEKHIKQHQNIAFYCEAIGQCLNVDPNKRPKLEELKDKFNANLQ